MNMRKLILLFSLISLLFIPTVYAVDAWTLLGQGNFFDAFLQVYIDIGIAKDIMYLFMTGVFCAILYIRTRSPSLVGLMLMLMGGGLVGGQVAGVFSVINASSMKYFVGIIVVGFGLAAYSLFKGD